MQLDHVVHVLTEGPAVNEAMCRSIRFSEHFYQILF